MVQSESGHEKECQSSLTKIEIQYFSILKEERGLDSESLELNGNESIKDIYNLLARTHKFSLPAPVVGAAINDQFTNMDAIPKNGDRVVFIPPVSGG